MDFVPTLQGYPIARPAQLAPRPRARRLRSVWWRRSGRPAHVVAPVVDGPFTDGAITHRSHG